MRLLVPFRWLPLIALLAAIPLLAQENPGVPWPATDALGRSLPLENEVGQPCTGKVAPGGRFSYRFTGQ
jgi:hypothetical protein